MDPSEIVEDPHRETKYRPDLTHTGLYVIDSDHASSFSVIPSTHPDNSIIPTSGGVSSSDLATGQLIQPLTRVADIQINATGGDATEQTPIQIRRGSTATDSPPVEDDVEQFSAHEREELTETGISREEQPIVPSSGYEDPLHYEDPVMHISGTGHWFLEGWIGDHSVEFLVESGSSVTAMSDIFYRNLVHAGAPVGALQITARTLRSANGTGIEVLGCSRCSVSFLGLRTEFPLSSAAWRRERTRSLERMCWGRCCHIHWTLRMDCCLHRAELHSNCIDGIQLYLVVFLRWAIHPYRHIRRLFCTVPSGLLVAAHFHLAACWRD